MRHGHNISSFLHSIIYHQEHVLIHCTDTGSAGCSSSFDAAGGAPKILKVNIKLWIWYNNVNTNVYYQHLNHFHLLNVAKLCYLAFAFWCIWMRGGNVNTFVHFSPTWFFFITSYGYWFSLPIPFVHMYTGFLFKKHIVLIYIFIYKVILLTKKKC